MPGREESFKCQICWKKCGAEFLCPGCCALPYCSRMHQKAHAKAGHSADCDRLKVQMSRAKELRDTTPSVFRDLVDDNHFHPHRLCSFLSAIGCHDMPLWQICCFLCKPEDLNSYGGIKRLKLHKQEKQIVCTPSNPPQEGNESLSEISKDPFSMDSKNVAGSAELGTLDHAFKKRKTGEHSCFPVFVHSNEQNVGWGLPADDCPQPPTVPSQEPLTSWSCYYWHMGIKPSSPIALLLHFPLTLYLGFCMSRESRLNIHQQMPNANLRIHYLGPREELSILEIFQELLHLIPDVEISIDFIGPDVPPELDEVHIAMPRCCSVPSNASQVKYASVQQLNLEYVHMDIPSPSISIGKCSQLGASSIWDHFLQGKSPETHFAPGLTLHRGTYHDWINHMAMKPNAQMPDLVFAPNAGLEAFSSWLPTLEILCQARAPIAFFTDYCEDAIVRPYKMLEAWGAEMGKAFINPFRQPLLQWDSGNALPSYSNGFGFIMGK